MDSHSSPFSTNSARQNSRTGNAVALVCCAFVLVLTVTGVWFLGPNFGDSGGAAASRFAVSQQFPKAPEFDGIAYWLNSEPLSVDDLRGKVVLVDFWTYTCVNCIRTFPQLRAWHDRYAENGLVIVGVHTPEFEFEKDLNNVQLAAETHRITWPIALDNDYVTWDNYENIFWPTKYLIDEQGYRRYYKVGEGRYKEIEEQIRTLLIEAGSDLSTDPATQLPDHVDDPAFTGSSEKIVTRELYAGYLRGDFQREYYGYGYVDQHEYYSEPGSLLALEAPEYLAPDFLYFHGSWINEDEYARHGRQGPGYGDYVALKFSARTVNAVFSNEGGEPVKVIVQVDGEYLTDENKGADVLGGPDGESYLLVDRPRMYRVVENTSYVQGKELRLSVSQENFRVYSFTFGVFSEGP